MVRDAHQPRQGHLTISRGRRKVQEGMPASITSAPVSKWQILSVFFHLLLSRVRHPRPPKVLAQSKDVLLFSYTDAGRQGNDISMK